MPWEPKKIEALDLVELADGHSYIATDGGPNVFARCYLCGAQAICAPQTPIGEVRCGECLQRKYEMMPGQRTYELKAEYAARWRAQNLTARRAAPNASSYEPRPRTRRG